MPVSLRFLVILCNLWEGWHGGAFSLGGGGVWSSLSVIGVGKSRVT